MSGSIGITSRAVRSFFPAHFLKSVAKANRRRPLDAEITILFQSHFDHLKSCTDLCDLFFIQDLAKKQFVWIEILPGRAFQFPDRLFQIQQALVKQNRTGRIAAMIFSGHGCSNAFDLGGSDANRLTDRDIRRGVLDCIPLKTVIIFFACETGKVMGWEIAKRGYHVIAATTRIAAHSTWLQYSANRFSMITLTGSIFSTESSDIAVDDDFNRRKINYLKQVMRSTRITDPKTYLQAVECLEDHYEKGFIVPYVPKQEFRYLKVLAKNGDPAKQFALANCYWSGYGVSRSMAECVYWTRCAAKQNYELAQRRMASFYEQGIFVEASQAQANARYPFADSLKLEIA